MELASPRAAAWQTANSTVTTTIQAIGMRRRSIRMD
jgi:hypothetical protein